MTLPKSLELRLRPCLLEKQEQVDWTSHSQTPTYPQAVCAGKDRPLDNSKTDDEMSRPSHPGHWAHYRGVIVCSEKQWRSWKKREWE